VSGNRRIHRVFERHVPLLRSIIRLDGFIYGSYSDIASEHEPLLLALESGDPDVAAECFRGHIERARDLVVDYVERNPGEL